ncbi:MAG: IS630 family transposase [Anaerolineales bacterium]|nr:IS630 family transposase [Anaerolineales bacterium]
MRKTKGQPRDFQEMERVRIRAIRLLQKGMRQSEVARKLGVTKQAVFRWKSIWENGGLNALRFPGRAGRKPELEPEQLIELERELLKGPKAHGYITELWTGRRVRGLIKKLFGVEYHPNHMWRLMRSMGWSCQRPTGRARERDEAATRRWRKNVWTRIKKRPEIQGNDRVLGRIRDEPASLLHANLGAERAYPCASIFLQLEDLIDGRRNNVAQGLFPAFRRERKVGTGD